MKRLIFLPVALTLASCGTIGNIRYDFASGSFSNKPQAMANTCATRMQNHSLDGIRGKVEFVKTPPDGPVPFTVLTNRNTPTADEQQAIGVWAKLIEQCQAEARPVIDQTPVPPQAPQAEVEKLASYITEAWIEGAKLRVALYNGELTYADYAGKRLSLTEDALKSAERYAQDSDEENGTHDIEDVETALAPFAALM